MIEPLAMFVDNTLTVARFVIWTSDVFDTLGGAFVKAPNEYLAKCESNGLPVLSGASNYPFFEQIS